MAQALDREPVFCDASWGGASETQPVSLSPKHSGAYYTPDAVVSTLINWAVRGETDRLLDPSCGDGRFIAGHRNSVGIERDRSAFSTAVARAPWATVHEGDFFEWATNTTERFECALGNPPFIRYQTFKGAVREQALKLCSRVGAEFSGLTSSWAPFLVCAASLLKPGGRLAFVVPAEIGHAPYAAPLLEYLVGSFEFVQIVAIREKLFHALSEDCWLLYADGFGGRAKEIRLTALHHFSTSAKPPQKGLRISLKEWREWNRRLRPFLISGEARDYYRAIADQPGAKRLGELASIGIGYVSGANDFFHLRPTVAEQWALPRKLLHPTVRNGRSLPRDRLTAATVEKWERADDPILLLRLPKTATVPSTVLRYLDTDDGRVARDAYKCRTRDPWFSVPDVQVPDFFLAYMSGLTPSLVRNEAGCTCTNSLHSVRVRQPRFAAELPKMWRSPFVQLSCELEGHPLGGGMLKLEVREATQVLFPPSSEVDRLPITLVKEAVGTMRAWRHYGT